MGEENVLRLQDPRALGLPGLDAFLERAFRQSAAPASWRRARPEVEALLQQPAAAVLVGREGADWGAVAIVFTPISALMSEGEVFYAYNEGGAVLRRRMARAVIAFCRERGCATLQAVDASCRGKPYERWVTPLLGTPKQAGTLYRFRIG